MNNKIIYVVFIILLSHQGGCSVPKANSDINKGSPCGSCYWNGKPKEASYQKKPIPPVRDWNTGVNIVLLSSISECGTALLHLLEDDDRSSINLKEIH